MRFLRVKGVETDQHDNDVRTLWRVLDVCQHLIVVAVQELDAELCLQGWILVTNAIQPGDLGNDVARCLPVAWTQLVLFRVEVFLLARQRCALAELEAAVQAPHAGHRRRQRSADQTARTDGLVQEWRGDGGRAEERRGGKE